MTALIMILIAALLGVLLLLRDEAGSKSSFFDREATGTLRGFWSLVILLVHVPPAHQNGIQDLLGSFGYIGVTFFFMTSGYGLFLGMERDRDYLRRFWPRRLGKLLIPMAAANVISAVVSGFSGQEWVIGDLFAVTGWVRQLLILYALFWLIYAVLPCRRDSIFFGAVILLSLAAYAGGGRFLRWPTESMGFLYGVLLYRHRDGFCRLGSRNWGRKIIAACALALVLGVAYISWKHHPFWGDYVLKLLLGSAILLILLLWNAKIPIGNSIGRFLGCISYELYLLHDPVFRLLDSLEVKWNSGLFIGVSIILTVTLSLVVHRFVEAVEGLRTWRKN